MKKFILIKCIFCFLLCYLTVVVDTKAGTILDYDGDGKTDLAVRRFDQNMPNYVWYVLQSRDGFRAQIWGLKSIDSPLFDGDYDGDGKMDFTVVRGEPNNPYLYWYILNSRDNTVTVVQWGNNINDRAVQQDYDGDGRTDIAVYRLGLWYILQSSNNQLYVEQFGRGSVGNNTADMPFTGGDYDGDGRAELAVVRYTPPNPAGSAILMTLFIRYSLDGTWASYNLGDARFTGVLSGDYDGDGRADVAIWQGNSWTWIRSSDNKLESVRFGQIPGDTPVPGDYDGDGKTDPAVYRRGFPQSYFYILQNRDGFKAVQWGSNNDEVDTNLGSTRYIPAAGF